ncbi:unnamed protein product [Didymodactylos carnosus]|uniref:Potassium channel tetramerisation-type BTB domain-containing protein n=1 Tax=Didymodactylos carnosus TaxID=1234261 RepID=A0A814AEF0_9BILA|nr:unnamed protein product [Didymodactylos carnosus]CAF3694261.1 unnamed protein product [Didymodactylos carnosus]
MQKFITNNDIIYLNVGGEKIVTSRGTLTLVPGTLLSKMFSGKWEDKIMKDKDGYIFLDYSPALFKCLIDQLREWNDTVFAEEEKVFGLPAGFEQQFQKFIQQLGFDSKYVNKSASSNIQESNQERFNKLVGKIELADNGKVARHDASVTQSEVRGTGLYSTGIHRIRLKMEKVVDWVYVGIINHSAPAHEHSRTSTSAYGWLSGTRKYVFIKGQNNPGYDGYDGDICENDAVDLVLNCNEFKIQLLNKRTSKQYEIPIDSQACPFPWQLNVNLYNPNTSVRILS